MHRLRARRTLDRLGICNVVVYLGDGSKGRASDALYLVLEGEVILTSTAGDRQRYGAGESFVVPKGWTGTWDMPVKFREKIIVETKAWIASEG